MKKDNKKVSDHKGDTSLINQHKRMAMGLPIDGGKKEKKGKK